MDLSEIKRSRDFLLTVLGLDVAGRDTQHLRCPFHEDKHGSLGVWEREGVWFWKCHAGCGSGTIIDAQMRVSGTGSPGEAVRALERGLGVRILRDEPYQEPILDEARAEHLIAVAHQTLMESFDLQETYLAGKRGITNLDLVRRLRLGFIKNLAFLGWRSWRVDGWVIPITRANGSLFAVKVHAERKNGPDVPKCFWAPFGTQPSDKPCHGGVTLWPAPEQFRGADTLYLCPGELKALALIGAGLAATSITGGEGGKLPERIVKRLSLVRPKQLVIPYDDDSAGRSFAQVAGTALEALNVPVLAIEYGSALVAEPAPIPDVVPITAADAMEDWPDEAEPSPPVTVDGWADDTRDLFSWFAANLERCPSQPFRLGPGMVTDPDRFYSSISLDIANGPDGPRARTGALASDLRALRDVVENSL